MSILDGFIKTRIYRKTDNGYKSQSQWTSSQTVEMDDGSTVEETVQDLSQKIADTTNSIITFTSNDTIDDDAKSWTSVTKLESGITHATLAQRISQMFKNVRYLYKMLGTTDISSIGGGTVTGAISSLNSKMVNIQHGQSDTYQITANTTNMIEVMFHEPFKSVPNVIITPFRQGGDTVANWGPQFVKIDSISTTGFTAVHYNNSSSTVANCRIQWIAMGE